MKPNDWDAWLRTWLKKHPLKMPISSPEGRFTQEVLARIRAEQTPAPVILRWIPKPRLTFALGGALAAVLVLALWIQRPARPLLRQIERDSQLLLESGELWTWAEAGLEEEWQEYDRFVLAQATEKATVSEDQEILQPWEELEALDEPPSVEEPESVEDLSNELRWIDEMELTV